MTEEKIQISSTCHFIKTTYGENVPPDISIDYTEHSTDHWHSDSETSIDIDKEKAIEIINFLSDAFNV